MSCDKKSCDHILQKKTNKEVSVVFLLSETKRRKQEGVHHFHVSCLNAFDVIYVMLNDVTNQTSRAPPRAFL